MYYKKVLRKLEKYRDQGTSVKIELNVNKCLRYLIYGKRNKKTHKSHRSGTTSHP